MRFFCFAFWFFYASRTALGVLLRMGAHEYAYFDSAVTLIFAAWIITAVLLSQSWLPVKSSSQPVSKWILLYIAWAFITLTWTPAGLLLSGGKLFKIATEQGIVFATLSLADVDEVAYYSLQGFIYGAMLSVCLYPLYPKDLEGRVGVADGIDGYNIAQMVAIAAVVVFIQWATKRDKRAGFRAILLSAGTVVLINKSCIVAYGIAVAPVAIRLGAKRLARILIMFSLLAWCVFPLVAPYLLPYIEAEGYLTLTGRLLLWQDAIDHISTHPLIGSGFDSAKVLLAEFNEFAPGHAHNEWLQNWMCMGLIGVILLGAIFISFGRVAWKHRRSFVGQAAMGLLLFGLVRGITDPTPDLCPPMGLMLLLAAVMNQKVLPEAVYGSNWQAHRYLGLRKQLA